MSQKRVFYAVEDEEFIDLIELLGDTLANDFDGAVRVTIEAIDAKEVPDEDDGEER